MTRKGSFQVFLYERVAGTACEKRSDGFSNEHKLKKIQTSMFPKHFPTCCLFQFSQKISNIK